MQTVLRNRRVVRPLLPKLNFVSAETETENERNIQFRQNRILAKMAEIRPRAETESVSVIHYLHQ